VPERIVVETGHTLASLASVLVIIVTHLGVRWSGIGIGTSVISIISVISVFPVTTG
jgi:hypothetical protein